MRYQNRSHSLHFGRLAPLAVLAPTFHLDPAALVVEPPLPFVKTALRLPGRAAAVTVPHTAALRISVPVAPVAFAVTVIASPIALAVAVIASPVGVAVALRGRPLLAALQALQYPTYGISHVLRADI